MPIEIKLDEDQTLFFFCEGGVDAIRQREGKYKETDNGHKFLKSENTIPRPNGLPTKTSYNAV